MNHTAPIAGIVYASILLGSLIAAGVGIAIWEALERRHKRR
jgi:hypothetical protein